jgi:hypothetical protein
MQNNRFMQIMLVVIAALLALNLVKGDRSLLSVATPAQAQLTVPWGQGGSRTIDCKPVRGYTVNQLSNVAILGDGKTFIVSNPTGFMVYQVDVVASQ